MIAKKLTYDYQNEYQNKKRVLDGVDLEVAEGMNIIIGPNASGKSTILKCMAGILRTKNSVFYEGREINKCKDLYHKLSYLPQQISASAALNVFEIMLLGKTEQLSWRIKEKDLALVESVMEEFGIINLASKRISEISGGQQQEVFIAQALIKNPEFLIIDEPTNNLDLKNQLEIMEKIRQYAKRRHARALIVLHDLNLAIRYADRLHLVKNGKIRASGKPDDVISEPILEEVYGIKTRIIKNGDDTYIVPETCCETAAAKTYG